MKDLEDYITPAPRPHMDRPDEYFEDQLDTFLKLSRPRQIETLKQIRNDLLRAHERTPVAVTVNTEHELPTEEEQQADTRRNLSIWLVKLITGVVIISIVLLIAAIYILTYLVGGEDDMKNIWSVISLILGFS